jgi:dihydroxy-acid dehydratase
MNCLTERWDGLRVTYHSGCVCGTRPLARQAGDEDMKLLEADIKPLDIMTVDAFETRWPLTGLGAPPTRVHLTPSRTSAAIRSTLTTSTRKRTKCPTCASRPGRRNHLQASTRPAASAGIVRACINRRDEENAMTVTEKPSGKRCMRTCARSQRDPQRRKSLFPRRRHPILRGSLAPEGAVVKQHAVAPEMLCNKGPARVFDGEEEASPPSMGAHQAQATWVHPVRRPRGGPGDARNALSPPRL